MLYLFATTITNKKQSLKVILLDVLAELSAQITPNHCGVLAKTHFVLFYFAIYSRILARNSSKSYIIGCKIKYSKKKFNIVNYVLLVRFGKSAEKF